MADAINMLRVISDYENTVVEQRNRIEALEAMLQKVVTQQRWVAACTSMTRPAMREGAAELADEIDAALGALPSKGSFTPPSP